MSKPLLGKVAVVTGASKGIGASIAVHLASAGEGVVINYSSSNKGADRVVSEVNGNGGKAVAVQANVSKDAEIRRLFAEGIGQPHDIAPAVVFLASEDSKFITGETLHIAGGFR